jgi:UDP-2-acetamido-2,6-beta-L-arabino-hexul-4-ose reductase
MKILITGSSGFIGRQLLYSLRNKQVVLYDKENDWEYLYTALRKVDFIFHLAAGIKDGFDENIKLTKFIVDNIQCPILFASSIQTESEYGKNKRLQEDIIRKYKGDKYIYRLSNVFGRWCRPYYNNVVASFVYDVQNNKELTINDPDKEVSLVYIYDVVGKFVDVLNGSVVPNREFYEVEPIYKIKVGDLANVIRSFKVDEMLRMKLYETYNG